MPKFFLTISKKCIIYAIFDDFCAPDSYLRPTKQHFNISTWKLKKIQYGYFVSASYFFFFSWIWFENCRMTLPTCFFRICIFQAQTSGWYTYVRKSEVSRNTWYEEFLWLYISNHRFDSIVGSNVNIDIDETYEWWKRIIRFVNYRIFCLLIGSNFSPVCNCFPVEIAVFHAWVFSVYKENQRMNKTKTLLDLKLRPEQLRFNAFFSESFWFFSFFPKYSILKVIS